MPTTASTDPTTRPAPSAPAAEFDADRVEQVDAMVAAAQVAAEQFRALDQEQVDRIVLAMVQAGVRAAPELARLAIEETGFGVFEDKVVKNFVATEFLYDYLKDKRSVGVIDEDVERNITYVAEPIGVVLAITPVTNPTSTVLYKAIIAAKTRNAVIFRPAPRAIQSCVEAVAVLRAAAAEVGLPENALQVVPDAAHVVTHYLFKHSGIDFIWVTGGPKIVALANAAGKPSLSVGPGNAPVYVHRTADIPGAVVDLLISKTFDASVICPAEQTCIVDDAVYDEMVDELQRMGGRVLTPEETDRLAEFAFGCGDPVNLAALGQPATELARRAGIEVEPGTKVLLCPLPGDLTELGAHPLVQEKLMPVLGLVRAESEEHAIAVAVLVTEHGGLGHTVGDLRDRRRRDPRLQPGRPHRPHPRQRADGRGCPRRHLQQPDADLLAGLRHLGRFQHHRERELHAAAQHQDGVAPPDAAAVVQGARELLLQRRRAGEPARHRHRDSARGHRRRHRAARRGRAGPVPAARRARLRLRGVYPEPGEEVIAQGVELLDRFRPDLMVAVGGGSVIDAAKAMRLFHEQPTKTLAELTLPFLDPRKRVADYSHRPHSVRLVAIPTTSGTGSEVSPAAVITVGPRKDTLVDYSLVPDIAIVDPLLTLTLPPSVTADSGIDALTHALEALVSIFASPYTEAFCVQSARLIFDALPRAFADGSDVAARTDMSNAATLAGLAFSNAFVGTNHALAHAVGARFDLPHGRANAIFLPHVMRYNAAVPTKFMPAPGYSSYVAPDKYALLGRVVFGGRKPEDSRARLFQAVDTLLEAVQMPRTLKDAGVDEQEFLSALPDLAVTAFLDLSNRTNPRMPLVAELTDLLKKGFYG